MTKPPQPSSLLDGITNEEVKAVMHRFDILGSVDKFTRVLQWCQQRTFEWMAEQEQTENKEKT